jgi:ABC-type cobalt transport system, permease component CbiQ and related transporters
MLTDITIGQYFPGNSLLHRLDPRTKIILLCLFILAIFLLDTPVAYGALTALTGGLIISSKLSGKMMLKSLKPLWWIILFTFLIHLCSTPGEALAKVWVFSLTLEGLKQGLFISVRLVLLILLSSLLTFTTSPLALTDALESLLSPFKRFGLPAHELAMMMTIALRFIPTLIEETDKIMKAQKSRGADFSSGSIVQRLKCLIPILVPLFISAFRRADELAMAMEARCYRGGIGRTRMKVLQIRGIDYIAYAAAALFGIGLTILKISGL